MLFRDLRVPCECSSVVNPLFNVGLGLIVDLWMVPNDVALALLMVPSLMGQNQFVISASRRQTVLRIYLFILMLFGVVHFVRA